MDDQELDFDTDELGTALADDFLRINPPPPPGGAEASDAETIEPLTRAEPISPEWSDAGSAAWELTLHGPLFGPGDAEAGVGGEPPPGRFTVSPELLGAFEAEDPEPDPASLAFGDMFANHPAPASALPGEAAGPPPAGDDEHLDSLALGDIFADQPAPEATLAAEAAGPRPAEGDWAVGRPPMPEHAPPAPAGVLAGDAGRARRPGGDPFAKKRVRMAVGSIAAAGLLGIVAVSLPGGGDRQVETAQSQPTVSTLARPASLPRSSLTPAGLGRADAVTPATEGPGPGPEAPAAPGPAPLFGAGPALGLGQGPARVAGPVGPASPSRPPTSSGPTSSGGGPSPGAQAGPGPQAAPAPAPAPAPEPEPEPEPAPRERRTETSAPTSPSTEAPPPPTSASPWIAPELTPPPPPPVTSPPRTAAPPTTSSPPANIAPSIPVPNRLCTDGSPPRLVPC